MNRRSRFEIYMDIMTALTEGPKNPTRLMYTTNLSWAPLQECLKALINQGLVQESGHNSSRKSYALTQKGNDIIGRYRDFMKDVSHLANNEQLVRESGMPMLR